MRLKTKLAGWATLVALMMQTEAADWPQWLGPNRDGISPEKGLMQEWPENGPKRVWLFENAGIGYSGPAVVDGKLYIMGARNGTEYLLALDAEKGEELWAAEIGELLKNDWGDGPRGTPSVSGDRVYTLGGQGTLVCASLADGKIIWKKNMKEFGGEVPNWGYTESVLVENGRVYCTPGGDKGALIALDVKTGELVWQSKDFAVPAHYSSIISADHNGTRQLIQLTEKKLAGIKAADGSVLWTSDWPGRTAVIPTPIYHDGHVYITTGYGVGCKLVKIGNNNPQDVYENKVMKNHHGGVVLVDGHIYGHSDGVGWVCQNFMSGDEVWAEEEKLKKGAVSAADGRLYCLEEDSGTVALIEPSPEGYKEHGRFTLQPQSSQRSRRGKIWTHPVIADGKLYLRDQELLFCFDIKGS